MEKNLEIKKLADVVVWADNEIQTLKDELTEEEFDECYEAKDLEIVKKVVLESMERHAVYTNALNKDIADKAAKIDLLEKEIEGRKAGYYNLKEKMDTKYISIEDHNMSTSLLNAKVEMYEKEIERLNRYNKNLETANNNLVTHVASLESEVNSRKKAFNDLKEEMANRYITIETHNGICETYDNKIAELEKELADRNVKIRHQKENLDGINKTLEIKTKEIVRLSDIIRNQTREIVMHEEENARLSERIKNFRTEIAKERNENTLIRDREEVYQEKIKELKKERDKHIIDRNATIMQLEKQVKYLEKELNETCTTKELDLKGHNRREMALVNELADKNDEIKKLNESIEEWKNQERIRTDQLRATESKVEELWRRIEKLKKGGDDNGKSGFKRYIEHLIEEEERAVPERFKERLNEEITAIFTKEEETEIKGNGRTNSGRYPWGAKVNDIPCGEDAIE